MFKEDNKYSVLRIIDADTVVRKDLGMKNELADHTYIYRKRQQSTRWIERESRSVCVQPNEIKKHSCESRRGGA